MAGEFWRKNFQVGQEVLRRATQFSHADDGWGCLISFIHSLYRYCMYDGCGWCVYDRSIKLVCISISPTKVDLHYSRSVFLLHDTMYDPSNGMYRADTNYSSNDIRFTSSVLRSGNRSAYLKVIDTLEWPNCFFTCARSWDSSSRKVA